MTRAYLSQVLERQKFLEQYGLINADIDIGQPINNQDKNMNGAVDDILYLQDPLTKSCGGCVLRNTIPDIGKLQIFSNTVLMSHIFFHLDEDSAIHDDEDAFTELMQMFYRDLRDAAFQYSFECSILTLQSFEDHEDSKIFGNWRYKESFCIEDKYVLSQLDLDSNSLISVISS